MVSTKDYIRVNSCYAGLKPGLEYVVLDEGYDWYKVRYNGGAVYVPTSSVENEREYQKRIRDERWEAMQDEDEDNRVSRR